MATVIYDLYYSKDYSPSKEGEYKEERAELNEEAERALAFAKQAQENLSRIGIGSSRVALLPATNTNIAREPQKPKKVQPRINLRVNVLVWIARDFTVKTGYTVKAIETAQLSNGRVALACLVTSSTEVERYVLLWVGVPDYENRQLVVSMDEETAVKAASVTEALNNIRQGNLPWPNCRNCLVLPESWLCA